MDLNEKLKTKTSSSNKIIDVHAHLAYKEVYSNFFLNEVSSQFMNNKLPTSFVNRIIDSVLSDRNCDVLIKQMDEAGIEKTVLLCTDFDFQKNDTPYSLKKMHELHIENVERHKDRLIAFAGVSPYHDETSYLMIKGYIEKNHFKGIKLYPPIGFDLTDIKLRRYYELCDFYSLPIMIHTGPSVNGFMQISNYNVAINLLSEKYKKANFILAHGAIKDHKSGIEMAKNLNNVYIDISSYQSEIDNIDILKEKLQECFENVPNKVMFGTDWPMYNFFIKQKDWVQRLYDLNILDDDLKELVMYKNAKEVLNI